MIPDTDIWRAANLLIRERGDKPKIVATGGRRKSGAAA
jgi:hypothetical protein